MDYISGGNKCLSFGIRGIKKQVLNKLSMNKDVVCQIVGVDTRFSNNK
jgi:hypothetical protein